jgi:hypothetical protein
MTEELYLSLADLVLVVHFAFVCFVVIGLLLIWIGWFRHWTFVRNIWFRMVHLAAIGVVAAESLVGFVCPLTTWENRLRAMGGAQSYDDAFIQHWLHRFMFFDLGEQMFTIIYFIFFLAVALSLWLVPPVWARRREQSTPPPL